MSEQGIVARGLAWVPRLSSRWWTALLGFSLMGNLLVGGIVAGGLAGRQRAERLAEASYVQLIPRSFFRELDGDRRKQLMQFVHDNRDELRNLRRNAEVVGLALADELEKPDFNLDQVKTTVAGFATGTESLAARGGDIVVQIISQLNPDERLQLAKAIRQRAEQGAKRQP